MTTRRSALLALALLLLALPAAADEPYPSRPVSKRIGKVEDK